MIRVLIVDDSATETAILKSILESVDNIHVIGTAKNGDEAVKLVPILRPDIITMDIQMPTMNGLEATRLIMEQHPTPIVVISSKLNDERLQPAFQALEAGALTVIDKSFNITSPTFAKTSKRIIDLVRTMSEIKVIRKRFHFNKSPQKSVYRTELPLTFGHYSLLAIGASVGGPQALKVILTKLPSNFPVPIVIVQHMTPGFINAFAKWLDDSISLHVKTACDGEILQKGCVYFAPDGYHLHVIRAQQNYAANLVVGKKTSGFCPSVTELLTSVAQTCGHQAVGVLLTGMGSDGAEGLLALKNAGGHTLIQDKQSAVVFGMAGVAQGLHAEDKVVELDGIADYLNKAIARH